MRKFFVASNQIENDEIKIVGQDVNHIRNVLRLENGEKILICDKDNSVNYISEIDKIMQDEIICKIIEKANNLSEGNVKITIFQGLPKADKMELIIQKGTELGVSKFVPVALKRSILKLEGKDEQKKIDRWNTISEVAAKQCGRDMVPKVENVKKINQVIDEFQDFDLVLLAYENEKENYIKNELLNIKDKFSEYNIAVIIGPEGGLEEKEVLDMKNAGAKVISLGNRILRTETVALQVSSIIMYELENGGI